MSSTVQDLVNSGAITALEAQIYWTKDTDFVEIVTGGGDNPTTERHHIAPDMSTEDKQKIAAKVQTLIDNSGTSAPPPPPSNGNMPSDPKGGPTAPATDGLPPPIKAPGGDGKDLVVSTAQLKKFAANVKILEDLVLAEYRSVATVNVKPGHFGAAARITTAVQVGLRNDTLGFLRSVAETFSFVRADIDKLVKEFDTAEEWNKLSAQQLNAAFQDTFSKINGYSEFGNSSTQPNAAAGTGGGNGPSGPNGPTGTDGNGKSQAP